MKKTSQVRLMNVKSILNKVIDVDSADAFDGLIEINGMFSGCISNGNEVFVAASGTLYGQVQAKKLVVDGKVKGKIEAECVVVNSSGQLIYEQLKYKDIHIEDGAVLLGNKKLMKRDTSHSATELNADDFELDIDAKPEREQAYSETEYKRAQAKKLPQNDTLLNRESFEIKGQPFFQSSF
jgi:cytoskeletal protein CcmA (bactofilin family)